MSDPAAAEAHDPANPEHEEAAPQVDDVPVAEDQPIAEAAEGVDPTAENVEPAAEPLPAEAEPAAEPEHPESMDPALLGQEQEGFPPAAEGEHPFEEQPMPSDPSAMPPPEEGQDMPYDAGMMEQAPVEDPAAQDPALTEGLAAEHVDPAMDEAAAAAVGMDEPQYAMEQHGGYPVDQQAAYGEMDPNMDPNAYGQYGADGMYAAHDDPYAAADPQGGEQHAYNPDAAAAEYEAMYHNADPSAAEAAAADAYGANPDYAMSHHHDAYGAHQQDPSAGGHGPAAVDTYPPVAPVPAGPSAQELADSMLAEERAKHEAALQLEAKAREELEDMILRIEKHFKAEQAARKKAEELLQAAIAGEMESKAKLEDVLKKRSQEQKLLEEERAAIKRERMALETMRQEFEAELQAARGEVAKAQEALAGSEERIRAAEQVERARLEAEYQSKLGTLQSELERMREELGYRTMMMNDEMEKWRQQAALTATAVMEAKNEVLERKKELDNTKEKMDRLLDKLLVGRERGIELSGAIASNQRMMSYMPSGLFGGGMHPMVAAAAAAGSLGGAPKLPPQVAMGMGGMAGAGMATAGAPGGSMYANHPYGAPMQAWGPNSQVPRLPPLRPEAGAGAYMASPAAGMQGGMQQMPMQMGMQGGYGMDPTMGGPQQGAPAGGAGVRRAASSHNMGNMQGGMGHTSRSEGHGGNGSPAVGGYGAPGGGAGGDIYAHVQSKFAQNAAEVSMQQRADVRARQKQTKNKKPDRFEEARRDNERIAGMAKRWN